MVVAGVVGVVFAGVALLVLVAPTAWPPDAARRETRLITAGFIVFLGGLSIALALNAFFLEGSDWPAGTLVAAPAMMAIGALADALVWRRYADREEELTLEVRRALILRLSVAELVGIAGMMIGLLASFAAAGELRF